MIFIAFYSFNLLENGLYRSGVEISYSLVVGTGHSQDMAAPCGRSKKKKKRYQRLHLRLNPKAIQTDFAQLKPSYKIFSPNNKRADAALQKFKP